MVVMTVSISDNVNQVFREVVKRKLGERKGVLAKALEEAINKWIEEEEQKQIAERQIKLAKSGLYSLKGFSFVREEAHER